MPQDRLIPSVDGWWCLTGGKVAHLPPEAAAGGRLVPEAKAALAQQGFWESRPRSLDVTVLTATTCNLGCAYCFQNVNAETQNQFAPRRIPRAILDEPTTAALLSFARQRQDELGLDEVSLMLFGGEPLLNAEGCVRLLEAMSTLNLRHAAMISNGTLLTADLAQRLEVAGLRHVQITFDGAGAVHDGIRVDHRGAGTFDRILANVRSADAVTDLAWNFRVNVSHNTIDSVGQLLDDLSALRLSNTPSVHFAMIDDVGLGYENRETYTPDLRERFKDFIDRARLNGLKTPVMGESVKNCPFCRDVAGAGLVVNADGLLYSCWETAGRPEWSVGSLTEGYLDLPTVRSRWVACDHSAEDHSGSLSAAAFYDELDSHILDLRRGMSEVRP